MTPDISLPSADLELALDSAITDMTNIPVTPTRKNSASSIPRSKRQPFEPMGNTDATPKAVPPASGIPRPVEPLAIKKKNSVRSSPGQGRKSSVRNSPLSKPVGKGMSPKRMSPRVSKMAQPTRTNPVPTTPLPAVVEQAWRNDDLNKLIKLAESTKIDVSPSRSPEFSTSSHGCGIDRVFKESCEKDQTGI
jgi:protein ECT2